LSVATCTWIWSGVHATGAGGAADPAGCVAETTEALVDGAGDIDDDAGEEDRAEDDVVEAAAVEGVPGPAEPSCAAAQKINASTTTRPASASRRRRQ